MKALIGLSAAAALLASLPSFACTPEEATAKAEQLAAKVNALTESDPDKAAEIHEEIRQMQLRRTADSLPNECAAYDRRMQELERAADEAEVDSKGNY